MRKDKFGQIELIAPAGDFEKLKTAVAFGANAVYMGGGAFSLRANAENFDDEALGRAVSYAHEHGAKAYIAVNVIARNSDFEQLPGYLKHLRQIGADAVIVSDPGVFMLAKGAGLDIHVSTQANVTNSQTAKFWRDMGAKRVILARELTLREIKEIRAQVQGIELEAFCHGSMCVAYSGRCLLSDYMTGRSANQGECAQPCRYEYFIEEQQRKGEFFRINDAETGSYILSPKDLRTVEFLPDMMHAGITGFKIEGRMKTPFYVACAVKAYKEALASLGVFGGKGSKDDYDSKLAYFENILNMPSNRGFHTGFYFGRPGNNAYRHDEGGYIRGYDFAGIVKDVLKGIRRSDKTDDIRAKIIVKGKIAVGDTVTWVTAKGGTTDTVIDSLYNAEMESVKVVTAAGTSAVIPAPNDVAPFDILARRV